MQYLGGKARIAKKLAPIILELAKGRTLVEPFCGGLSMTEQLHPVFASDASVSLISLIQAMRNGWQAPDSVSEQEYTYARTLPETHPAHGFCGYGCSFSGKLWGGYARAKTWRCYASSGKSCYKPSVEQQRNYSAEARATLIRKIAATYKTEFGCCSYADWIGNLQTIFYCDPPYVGTANYGVNFDSDAFWQWCIKQTKLGAIVIVSEYKAPTHIADCILELNTSRYLNTKSTVERLFKVR